MNQDLPVFNTSLQTALPIFAGVYLVCAERKEVKVRCLKEEVLM
jgi:hypothetical protein